MILRQTLICSLFLISSLGLSAQNIQYEWVDFKHMDIGTIQVISDTYIIEQIKGRTVERYYPVNLGREFMIEGLQVAFSGQVARIPANVRMIGRPIKLQDIRKLSKVNTGQPKPDNEKTSDGVEKKGDMELKLVSGGKEISLQLDSSGNVSNEKGRIFLSKPGDIWLIEANQGPFSIIYYPIYLPEDFKVDGMNVVFSGPTAEAPDYVKLGGIPIDIHFLQEDLDMKNDPTLSQPQIDDAGLEPFEIDTAVRVEDATFAVRVLDQESELIVLVPLNDPSKRFKPRNLPKEFSVDGMIVTVSGKVGKIPPNVRLIGTPFLITAIIQTEE